MQALCEVDKSEENSSCIAQTAPIGLSVPMLQAEVKGDEEVEDIFASKASLNLSKIARVCFSLCWKARWSSSIMCRISTYESPWKSRSLRLEYYVLNWVIYFSTTLFSSERGVNRPDFSRDWFCTDKMKAMAKFCEGILKPTKHGHIFCIAFQYGPWYRVLIKEVEVV